MKFTELKPTNRQKSFYGKAKVYTNSEGEIVLRSYDTDVIKKTVSGEFVKLWNGRTATTTKHIKSFVETYA